MTCIFSKPGDAEHCPASVIDAVVRIDELRKLIDTAKENRWRYLLVSELETLLGGTSATKKTKQPILGHAANGFICPWDSEGRVCSQHKD